MKMASLALAAILAAAIAPSSLWAAQLYRWIDERGNVEWRDTPPPPGARQIEQRKVSGNTIETSTLPYSVQQAIKNHPVTLWTVDCGEPCSKATAHLARRGVPHTVRNARKEPEALEKATGGRDVPVLSVGSQLLKGYLESSWDAALDSAGYPHTPLPGVKAQTAAKEAILRP
jgi:hypothetical protein